MREFRIGEVRTAVAQYIEDHKADAHISLWSAQQGVGALLGLGPASQWRSAPTRIAQMTIDRFDAQVARTLNAMAADGTLVKVGKGQEGPERAYAGEPWFYTPAQFEAAKAAAMARFLAEEDERRRWHAVADRFAAAGYEPVDADQHHHHTGRGWPFRLSLEDFERLADSQGW